MNRVVAWCAVVVLVFGATGCGTLWGVPSTAMRDLRRLYACSSAYAKEHENRLPESMSDLKNYLGSPRLMKEYRLVASGDFTDIQASAEIPVFQTRNRNWDGDYIAIFGDGRCGKIQTSGE